MTQPPMMHGMSPYRRIHAPHLTGYFETGPTSLLLAPVAGGTALTITAQHRLRIDPAPYWEPLARWAIRGNVRRVLDSLGRQAEAHGGSAGHGRSTGPG
jgi:hypothetical protein